MVTSRLVWARLRPTQEGSKPKTESEMKTQPEALIARLIQWIDIDSVTPNEGAYLEALEQFFLEQGYTCERQDVEPGRWNLLAMRKPNPRVLLSTHVDTVPPFIPARREGDVIYGRGACDTKGGLVAMTEAARRLDEAGLGQEVGFLLVVGEEVNHIGAKTAPAWGLSPTRIILGEPTRNKVVSAQKGMIKMDICAHGKAAHSAYPLRGDSALHRTIDALHGMLHADWPEHDVLGPTTLNVGMLEGGVAHNVFAPKATGSVLMRTVAPTAQYEPQIKALTEPHRVEAPIEVENDPVFFDPPQEVETCTVAFNTDATYLGPIAPVWLVGPGDIEVAHTDHEHITLEDILEGADLYERLLRLALKG